MSSRIPVVAIVFIALTMGGSATKLEEIKGH
jgi:hypothetical protein